jgi:CRP/FNR family transcriptional regulator, cyclic AMP receptor protein
MDAANILMQTELFGHLDRSTLDATAPNWSTRTYQRGEIVFNQGDRGDAIYVLVEGVAKVFLTSEDGDQMVLVTLRPPATFGELALVDGLPRSASVEALERLTVLVLSRRAWGELVEQHPELRAGLLTSLGALLRRLTDQASDFVFLDLQGRVAKVLVTSAEERGERTPDGIALDLNMTQGDVARMVGGSRQAVNQILGSLASRGYLELHGRTIVIRDLEPLRRRAGFTTL